MRLVDANARLRELLQAVGAGGNLVHDAHLAALALEQRGDVVSYDNDFDRFPGVGAAPTSCRGEPTRWPARIS